MSMSTRRYEFIKREIQKRIAYHGGVGMLTRNSDVVNPVTTMWKLFNATMADVTVSDAEKKPQDRPVRVSEYIKGFKVYRDDNGVELHDEDIKQALYKLGKELGVIK